MEVIKVAKAELLSILKKNRDSHKAVFEEAQKGYRKEAIEALDKALQDARSGRNIRTVIRLDAPVNQTSDYDRAIKMVEMSIDENIEIGETDFANYVLDDWHWKTQNFNATNAYYIQKSRE